MVLAPAPHSTPVPNRRRLLHPLARPTDRLRRQRRQRRRKRVLPRRPQRGRLCGDLRPARSQGHRAAVRGDLRPARPQRRRLCGEGHDGDGGAPEEEITSSSGRSTSGVLYLRKHVYFREFRASSIIQPALGYKEVSCHL